MITKEMIEEGFKLENISIEDQYAGCIIAYIGVAVFIVALFS